MENADQSAKVMCSFSNESRALACANGFLEMFDRPDFEVRRAKLVAGMPKKSVNTVDRILRRLKVVLNLKEGETADIYTQEEQNAFVDASRRLHSKIVQLSPDLFVWNGYALPHKHFEPNVFLDGYGLRFIKTLGNIGDKAIIDAGAYIGDSALMLAPLTSGKVFAFEPVEANFKCLEKTIWLNGLDNVIPVHSALGDCCGTLTMSLGNAGSCATVRNKLLGEILKRETVGVARLDEFVQSRGISVGLIKTDVEGAEQMLLRGAKEVIQRDRPILLISIYHTASDFMDIKPMIESWELGYQFEIYHPPIKSVYGETVLIAECGKHTKRHSARRVVQELETSNRRLLQICAASVESNNVKLAEAWTKHGKVQGELVATREKLSDAYADREQLKTKLSEAWSKHDKIRNELVAMRGKLSDAYADREQLKTKLSEAWSKHDKVRDELVATRGKLSDAYADREHLKTKLSEAWSKHDKVRDELVATRGKLSDAYADREQLKTKLSDAWSKHDNLKLRLDSAMRREKSLTAELDECKDLLVSLEKAIG